MTDTKAFDNRMRVAQRAMELSMQYATDPTVINIRNCKTVGNIMETLASLTSPYLLKKGRTGQDPLQKELKNLIV